MKLIILPNLLDRDLKADDFLPHSVNKQVGLLDGLIAESEKGARIYLRQFLQKEKSNTLPVYLLNEHTKQKDIIEIIKEIKKGGTYGLISDAGLPSIADPGSKLVFLCHRNKIKVKGVGVPSSILLALLLSGLEANRFCFHGYLAIDKKLLKKSIKNLESTSYKNDSTQVFIETPYRAHKLLEMLLCTLRKDTFLSVCKSLNMKDETVITKEVFDWKKTDINLLKKQVVFLIYGSKRYP